MAYGDVVIKPEISLGVRIYSFFLKITFIVQIIVSMCILVFGSILLALPKPEFEPIEWCSHHLF